MTDTRVPVERQGAPDELALGFKFRLPPENAIPDADPVATALAAFGMIGLAAGELITYPYRCLVKGYAQATGPREATPAWAERARDWMRVMRLDAWLSTRQTLALIHTSTLSRESPKRRGEKVMRCSRGAKKAAPRAESGASDRAPNGLRNMRRRTHGTVHSEQCTVRSGL